MEIPRVLQSSENNQNVSLTFQGAAVLLAVYLFNQSGIDISQNEVLIVIETLTAFIGAGVALYGGLRRLRNKFDR